MKSIRAQVYDQDQCVILSPLEYSLFQWLKLHRGDVISRETLLKMCGVFNQMEIREPLICVCSA